MWPAIWRPCGMLKQLAASAHPGVQSFSGCGCLWKGRRGRVVAWRCLPQRCIVGGDLIRHQELLGKKAVRICRWELRASKICTLWSPWQPLFLWPSEATGQPEDTAAVRGDGLVPLALLWWNTVTKSSLGEEVVYFSSRTRLQAVLRWKPSDRSSKQ